MFLFKRPLPGSPLCPMNPLIPGGPVEPLGPWLPGKPRMAVWWRC